MVAHPIIHISTELDRYALNIDLVARQITGNPDPLDPEHVALLTPTVQHIHTALDRLERALHQEHR